MASGHLSPIHGKLMPPLAAFFTCSNALHQCPRASSKPQARLDFTTSADAHPTRTRITIDLIRARLRASSIEFANRVPKRSGGNHGDLLPTWRRRPHTILLAGQTMNCTFITSELNGANSHDFQRIAPKANLQIHSFAFCFQWIFLREAICCFGSHLKSD